MKPFYYLLFTTMLFSQELEVDGALKVTGEIDATGNVLTNLGDPVSETDAVNLRSLNEAGGMKVERIYTYVKGFNTPEVTFTVPADKVWYVIGMAGYDNTGVKIDGVWIYISSSVSPGGNAFWLLPNQEIMLNETWSYHLSILEYSFTNSGTSQGLDYVEP